ncbi:LysR family transcriptional regulator [Spiractinospora alimapuensis]|uniref:LysR substrate-binding domain-containing protein n=1 Tax=Spiractinospora alimapuensis TaxID=2820884 RepID=UPI001F48E339|nr:LysR substrate-binding domain-containing protein [Spiractinospora alimapuensis]QVQ50221.1 LysR family transcriptional regulator [Spiractinospora alimapuensis]
MALDLHKLEHLIAVVEEGTFTRASARLCLTQQALSSSIRALEREIGVDLLDRGGSPLAVTAAGQALIGDARVLRGAAETALRRVRRIGRNETEILHIGHTPAVTADEVIALVHQVHAVHPDLPTQVNQRYPAELNDQLRRGEIDLGLSRAMSTDYGLDSMVVTRHRLNIAIDAGHRLAGRDTLHLAELAEEPIMVWGHPGRSGYTDLLVHHCREAGFEPHIRRNPIQGTPPVTAVLGTRELAFVTAPPGTALEGKVHVVELLPPTFVPVRAMWPRHTTSAVRDAFLSVDFMGGRDHADAD